MGVDEEKIKGILESGVLEIIEKKHLEEALKSGTKLKVKFGIDPTAPDIHLGHSVPLRKLRQFQDLGHEIILIIGDFTAQIGDPSGKEDSRKQLSAEEVKNNFKKYLSLADKIIDVKKVKVLYNSNWLKKTGLQVELSSKVSIQQALERDDFQKRFQNKQTISLLEIFYPLFQGYDSVAVMADVEIGGNDQKFNLLMGRKIQRAYNLKEQDVLTTPLLLGLDGSRKMSKSLGNYISLDEEPNAMFSKVMTMPDELITQYTVLLTDLFLDEIKKQRPYDAKKILAYEIVKIYHGEKEAKKAREYFEKTFSKKGVPPESELKKFKIDSGETWGRFLMKEGFVKSMAEAKRLIDGGGIDFGSTRIKHASDKIIKGGVAKIGKYKFIKIVF